MRKIAAHRPVYARAVTLVVVLFAATLGSSLRPASAADRLSG